MWTVRYMINGQLDETDTFDSEMKAAAEAASLLELGIFDRIEVYREH